MYYKLVLVKLMRPICSLRRVARGVGGCDRAKNGMDTIYIMCVLILVGKKLTGVLNTCFQNAHLFFPNSPFVPQEVSL